MAKIVDVRYGLTNVDNSGKPYKYVVNDNVKKGDALAVVATNHKSGKKFATMGVVQKSISGGSRDKNARTQLNDLYKELSQYDKQGNYIGQAELKVAEKANVFNGAMNGGNTHAYSGFNNKSISPLGNDAVDNSIYENSKKSVAVQNERQNVLTRESQRTSQLVQPTENTQASNAVRDEDTDFASYYVKHLWNRQF